jgi:complement component 1 Q subcomponent-binding protein
VPEFIQSFKEHGVWTIEDVPGTDNYSLTRKFGNETYVLRPSRPRSVTMRSARKLTPRLKLTFQVSDLEEGNEPDPEIERPDGAEEFDQPPFISGSLSITKPATPGALLVDLEAGEEGFVITNVALFEKAVAEAEGPEGDYNRRSMYMGPREWLRAESGVALTNVRIRAPRHRAPGEL